MAWPLTQPGYVLKLEIMRLKFFIIPALLFRVAVAQNGPASSTNAPVTATTAPVTALTEVPVTPNTAPATSAVSTAAPVAESGEVAIMDYKSVYETATVEEEVQMAAERYRLTKSQQEVWLGAAKDRRDIEKQAHAQLAANAVTPDYNFSRDAVYRGLRTAQNNFYEAIIGYLNPSQKQAMEFDRTVLAEKQRRLAKIPPPPPPAPVDTVKVPAVDSTAIKEAEKLKNPKKSKKKKKKSAGA